MLDVEIEGARQIRKNLSNSLLVFVLPPSAEVLIERLKGRNTENRELLRKRLIRAAEELTAVAEYDYAIVNEDLVTAVAQVSAILDGKADDRLVCRQNQPARVDRAAAARCGAGGGKDWKKKRSRSLDPCDSRYPTPRSS